MINIVVVDDHPLMQEGIKIAVDNSIDMKVTGKASNWGELLTILNDHIPDIIILDINMPDKSGLDILKDLQNQHPHLPVLILSMHSEKRFAVRTLKAGAMGYLNKSSISDELEKAIRRIVSRNKKYITPKVAELISEQVNHNNNQMPHESLTDREFQIFCKIASGEAVNKIASELSLSTQTVYTYRANIKEKMNFNSNVEMARYAINNNLIE
jgi:DNA-binding NarL/FixJ family response regulator